MEPFLLSLLDLVRSYLGEISIPNLGTDRITHIASQMFSSAPGDSSFIADGLAKIHGAMAAFSSPDSSIVSPPLLLLAAGVVIFLGVLGEAFFKKTGVPDLAFIMLLGVAFGPVLGMIQPVAVMEIVPYFAALALIIIMFDGGLNLDFKGMAKTVHFATALSIIGFGISTTIVAFLAHFGLGWEWLDSFLLGSIVGGSSSAIVFGLVRNLKISSDGKSLLSFESALTDILATIVAFVLLEAIMIGSFDPFTLGESIIKSMFVGLVLGFCVGIPWLFITSKLSRSKHVYMLTLGLLFVLYFFANAFGESGALTALVFGLMLGNKRHLAKYLKFKLPTIESDDSMHNQLTFLVRTFFFVFVGLMATFGNIEYMVFGVVAAITIYAARVILCRMTLTKRFSKLDRKVTSVMVPRGLAAAVLATFPITMGIPNAEAYPPIIFVIILASVIITTIGLGGAKKIPPPEATSGGYIWDHKTASQT